MTDEPAVTLGHAVDENVNTIWLALVHGAEQHPQFEFVGESTLIRPEGSSTIRPFGLYNTFATTNTPPFARFPRTP